MKKLLLIILTLSAFGCKKGSNPAPKPTPQPYIIGAWDRLATNDTVYTGSVIDSIHYDKVVASRTLLFYLNGVGRVKDQLINLSYSGNSIVIESSPIEAYQMIKVSDTKIRLIRHLKTTGSNSIGYNEEYSKE